MRPPLVYPVHLEPRVPQGYEERSSGLIVPRQPPPPPKPKRGRPPRGPVGKKITQRRLRRRDDEVGVRARDYIRPQKGLMEHYTDEFALRPHCAQCGATSHRGGCARAGPPLGRETDLMDEEVASWWGVTEG